jgi:catechol 2,3-dioxygenase-like lactoylglutathione lyase family enzyme
MSSGVTSRKEAEPHVKPVDMKLEVVLLSVSDVDRAKEFYEKLGWRVDIDIAGGDFRGVQITPHNSDASIIFGKGSSAQRGSAATIVLAVDDVEAARNDLIGRGVNVSEIFHYAAGPFNETVENPRVPGRDPEGRSYFSFASFEDPDGNSWLLQEITTRLPGRLWESQPADVATLADLLHETAEHHDVFEKTHAVHNWWDWYAAYFSARQSGRSSEEATAGANRYMEETLHVLPR